MANPNAATQRAAHANGGREVPPHLWPPEVMPGTQPWLDEFWELSTERQIGMAAGPIPRSAIAEAAERYPPKERVIFKAVMRALDSEWMGKVSDGPAKADKPVVSAQPLSPSLFRAMVGGGKKK